MERAAAVGATALALVATLGAVEEITMGSGNGDPSGSAAGTARGAPRPPAIDLRGAPRPPAIDPDDVSGLEE